MGQIYRITDRHYEAICEVRRTLKVFPELRDVVDMDALEKAETEHFRDVCEAVGLPKSFVA